MENKKWYSKSSAGADIHGQHLVINEATGKNIAVVYNGAENAALLAAAPELMEALEYLYDTFHDGERAEEHAEDCNGRDVEGCCFCKARAAIAKAKGQ